VGLLQFAVAAHAQHDAGPTVCLLPDAFLRRDVDVLGRILVTAPDLFLDVLNEGGSGHHFFGRSAEKVILPRRAASVGRQFDSPAVDTSVGSAR
jgi:uncharacterized protein (DUF4213/DUF364 family)